MDPIKLNIPTTPNHRIYQVSCVMVHKLDNLFHHLPISHSVHEHQLFMDRQIYVIVPWIPFWDIHSLQLNEHSNNKKWGAPDCMDPVWILYWKWSDVPLLLCDRLPEGIGVVTSNQLNGPCCDDAWPCPRQHLRQRKHCSSYVMNGAEIRSMLRWPKRDEFCHGKIFRCPRATQRHPLPIPTPFNHKK